MECPEWMNTDFFDEIYVKREDLQGKKYTLSGISCSEVVGTGDNYASVMYRAKVEVKVEGGNEKIVDSFIVKSTDNTMEMFKDYGIFRKEVEAYQMVIPECEKFWKDAGYVVEFGPKCLKATTGGQEVLVLSDLKKDGYVMMDRFKGLDLKCAEMTFEKLAKFHAASIAYKEKVTNIPKHLDRDFIDDTFEEMYKSYGDSSIICLADILEKNNFDQKYVNKIRRLPKILLDELKIIGGPKKTPDELQCLVHGDLWMNNQMYKLDEEGNPNELIFIDFQIMYWGRPITDILYFLISSVRPDIVIENFDYLFKYYHDHLVKSMKILGVKQKPPTLKNFRIELQKYGFFVCNCMVEILPVVLMDRTELSTMENFFDEGENGQKLKTLTYSNPRYLEVMSKYLPFFDNKGFLDSDFNPDDEELKSDLPLQETKTSSDLDWPQWMTGEFFDEIYEKREELKDKNYKINVVSCGNVVDIGDNYLSKLYRTKVEVEVEGSDKKMEESFIIKSVETTDPMIAEYKVYANEKEAYTDAIPAITQFWEDIGEIIDFGPKCLKATAEPHDIMVLTDLKPSGYIMLNRFEGVDLEHAKMTLRKLAKFHAGSLLYKEKNGSFGPMLSRKFMAENYTEMFSEYTKTAIDAVVKNLEKNNFDPKILNKIKNWHKSDFKEILHIFDPDSDYIDLSVLIHGDLWLNNQLFKYDEKKKLKDVIFVDFQICYWGRPATDIFYFLVSSVKPKIVIPNFNSLLEEYYNELVSSCEKLGVKRKLPAFINFLDEINKCGYIGGTLLFEIVPVVLMEKNENAKIENFMNDSEGGKIMKDKMYNNPKYLRVLESYLSYFDKMGYLDLNILETDKIEADIGEVPVTNGELNDFSN